jgi:nicotinate (nicotinamide) nucleotide adenylyltransferase
LTPVRIGVFGGTFDPPHVGHLLAASDAYEALMLDRLLFVPAGMQPFKVGAVHATGRQRLEMLSLLVNADQRFAVDPIEIEREGLSFTVDTLATLADREAGAALFLLVGQDLAGQIGTWREPARIAELAEIVVLSRPGCEPAASMPGAVTLPMRRLQTRRIELSSREIRERVRTGKSIHGFVPDAVADYIESAGLYR